MPHCLLCLGPRAGRNDKRSPRRKMDHNYDNDFLKLPRLASFVRLFDAFPLSFGWFWWRKRGQDREKWEVGNAPLDFSSSGVALQALFIHPPTHPRTQQP